MMEPPDTSAPEPSSTSLPCFEAITPQMQSRFLCLPLDVRYLIYDAIVQNARIELERKDLVSPRNRPSSPIFPYSLKHVGSARIEGWLSMLQTCRQIYSESIRAVYGATTFTFTSLRILRSFLWTTPAYQLSLVRHIVVAIQNIDGFSLPYNFLCNKIGCPDEWLDLFPRLREMRGLDRFELWMQDERKTLYAIEARPWQRIEARDAAWEAALESRHRRFWEGLKETDVPVYAHVNWDAKDEEQEKVLVRVMTKQQMYDSYWNVIRI